MLKPTAMFGALAMASCGTSASEPERACLWGPTAAQDVRNYHGGPERSGWNPEETELGAHRLRGVEGGLAERWSSPGFQPISLGGQHFSPFGYAAPLYADDVVVRTPGGVRRLPVIIAATNLGQVVAVAASAGPESCDVERGAVVWETAVGTPMVVEELDKGVPIGILSTPVLDLDREDPRVYVASLDAEEGWQVWALRLEDGGVLPGYPVSIRHDTLDPVNTNAPAQFWAAPIMSQRGALALSPEGDRLYVAFGTFWGRGAGWIAAVDTEAAEVASAFSAAPSLLPESNGGIWGSGGPGVDAEGRVWLTTGNSPPDSGSAAGVWGSSLLQLDADLRLERVYSPFNYCTLDARDFDLGASQPTLLPELTGSSTPHVAAFGGKQGNVYLVDRDTMSAASGGRAPCTDDASADRSLLPPEPQPQFGSRGPLNVFGPYSDEFGKIDHAKMRTKLAYWEDATGAPFLFASGSTKAAPDSTDNVAPSVAKLRVVTEPDQPAYLEIDAVNPDVVMVNPGSPIVSGRGADAVVWVIDRNAPRTAALLDPATPGAVVYAFDAASLELLWSSSEGELGPIGKYGTPIVVHGELIVVTDRVQAFSVP